MRVMGLRKLPYWLGTFIFDYLGYLLIIFFLYFMIVVEDIKFMKDHINKIILILSVFGADLILFAYLCGFFY
jgi:ATP-binding cassette subfamily A (ABC1) protein 3